MLKMKGLSSKELEIVSKLEFDETYYFSRDDIRPRFENHKQMLNTIYRLKKKGRIVPLSKKKYFLVPIKAPESKWTDNPLIVLDQMFNSKDYIIGAWYAAWYWKLTDQVPMQIDVYTTKRQGVTTLLNKRYVFHRTTKNKISKAVIEKIRDNTFRIVSKEDTKKWFKSRNLHQM